jgi:ABC-type thiamine transport system substrate-binding protein
VEDESYYQKFQGQNIEINVYNWGEYIANDALGFVDVNQEFEKLTGIKVNYTMFSSNEETVCENVLRRHLLRRDYSVRLHDRPMIGGGDAPEAGFQQHSQLQIY